jgi:hypothetical protein
MSSAYHPETDGASERSNKTINQCLRYHVERNQKGWVLALPRVRFDIMNTVNKSTGFSPFHLRIGRSPRLIPPLLPRSAPDVTPEEIRARAVIESLGRDVLEAQDNLLAAKVSQAHHANKRRSPEIEYVVGDLVMLSTENRRRDYKSKNDDRVAKFMPRYDGPYKIIAAMPEKSLYTLDIPNSPGSYTSFHSKHLKKCTGNNAALFPSRERARPETVTNSAGEEEFFIDKIIDERRKGRGYQYLVTWRGEGPEENRWLPRRELEDCEALELWLNRPK